jgi:hypothetical protein
MKRCLLLSLLLVAACGSADDAADVPPPGLPPIVPLPECPDENYVVCDIRDADCQAGLAKLAACLRGNATPPDVPIEVMTEAEYAEVLRQDNADNPEPPVKHFDRAISVFGLAPADGVPREDDLLAYVADIGGVYRGQEKRIVIIDHGKPADAERADLTLLHELVHALQDADHDLAHWPEDQPTTFDAALARVALIEGEASFYQYRAAVPLLGLDIAEIDFEMAMQEHLALTLERAFDAPLLLSQSFATVPYGMGALLAFHAWQEGGAGGLDPLWAAPPRTVKQLLSQVFRLDLPDEDGVDIAEPVVADLQLYGDDVLGAWGLNLVLGQQRKTQDSLAQALGWRGDHLWVYTDASNRTLALWQLQLDTPEAAQALERFFGQRLAHGTHEAAGSRVFVSYGVEVTASEASLAAWGRSWLAEQ